MLDESTIIARLCRIIPSHVGKSASRDLPIGIGDDAAVLRGVRAREWVVSADAFIEGRHFLSRLHPPSSVGFKSLARAASDLAAMGAAPRYFLLTLSLPPGKAGRWLDNFARGMARAARLLRLRLIGGDVSRSEKVLASVTVIGVASRAGVLTRSGARPGDALYVSGKLGAAQAGLEILLRRRLRTRPAASYNLLRHLHPLPRIALGSWLARHHLASAAMDLSDGLSTDLTRLSAASGARALVHAAALPLASEPRAGYRRASSPRERAAQLRRALHGGEDYELLFAVPPHCVSRIPALFHGVPLTRIGEIARGRGVILLDADGRRTPLRPGGWDHFASRR